MVWRLCVCVGSIARRIHRCVLNVCVFRRDVGVWRSRVSNVLSEKREQANECERESECASEMPKCKERKRQRSDTENEIVKRGRETTTFIIIIKSDSVEIVRAKTPKSTYTREANKRQQRTNWFEWFSSCCPSLDRHLFFIIRWLWTISFAHLLLRFCVWLWVFICNLALIHLATEQFMSIRWRAWHTHTHTHSPQHSSQ